MCGKAYDPRFIFTWPTAKIAVMSGTAAANTLLQIKLSALEREGKSIKPEEKKSLLNTIKEQYDKQLSPYYAAARLWTDGIIDPLETRKIIAMGIEIANQSPIRKKYNVGIIQT